MTTVHARRYGAVVAVVKIEAAFVVDLAAVRTVPIPAVMVRTVAVVPSVGVDAGRRRVLVAVIDRKRTLVIDLAAVRTVPVPAVVVGTVAVVPSVGVDTGRRRVLVAVIDRKRTLVVNLAAIGAFTTSRVVFRTNAVEITDVVDAGVRFAITVVGAERAFIDIGAPVRIGIAVISFLALTGEAALVVQAISVGRTGDGVLRTLVDVLAGGLAVTLETVPTLAGHSVLVGYTEGVVVAGFGCLVAIAGIGGAVLVGIVAVISDRTDVTSIRHPIAVGVVAIVGIFTGVAGIRDPVAVVIECVVACSADIPLIAHTVAVVIGARGICVSTRIERHVGL